MTVRNARALPLLVLLILAVLAGAACEEDSPTRPEPVQGRVYLIAVGSELFRVEVSDPQAIEAFEARRTSGVIGVISGTLVAGDGGVNQPWSWHLEPSSVHAPDVSVGTCGGSPTDVEEDLGYWLDQVGDFCPATAYIVAVLE